MFEPVGYNLTMKRLFRKIVLQHTILRYLVFDGLGFIWFLYFLWLNEVLAALVSLVVFWTIASMLVSHIDEEKNAATSAGKFALGHLAPWSAVWHALGYAVGIYGVWIHSGFYILVGFSLILLGHLLDKK